MKSLETMARYKKELTECARNLKLPFLAEHLDEILHEAQEKQQTYSEFLSTCLMRELRDKERRSYLTRLKFAGLPMIWIYMISHVPKGLTKGRCANCVNWYG